MVEPLMCGLFGYAGDAKSDPRLTRMIADAGRRGPHAHGWIADGALVHQLGPMNPAAVPTARLLVGHARLATAGDPADPRGIQPLLLDDGTALVHNGTLPGWHYSKECPSDSWLLIRTYSAFRARGYPPAEALYETMTLYGWPGHAVIVAEGTTLAVSHLRLPLWVREVEGRHAGIYVSSVQFDGAQPADDGVTTWEVPCLARS